MLLSLTLALELAWGHVVEVEGHGGLRRLDAHSVVGNISIAPIANTEAA